jgi:hypothetical protein
MSISSQAEPQNLDKLYYKYSSNKYIAAKQTDKLKEDARNRLTAILKHLASAQKASLKRDFTPAVKRASRKRSQHKSLLRLLDKVSPIKKEEP